MELDWIGFWNSSKTDTSTSQPKAFDRLGLGSFFGPLINKMLNKRATVTSSNGFFCPTNSPKPHRFVYIIMSEKSCKSFHLPSCIEQMFDTLAWKVTINQLSNRLASLFRLTNQLIVAAPSCILLGCRKSSLQLDFILNEGFVHGEQKSSTRLTDESVKDKDTSWQQLNENEINHQSLVKTNKRLSIKICAVFK